MLKDGLIISHKYKFIFLHFFKTGGTSIVSALNRSKIGKFDSSRRITLEECRQYGVAENQAGQYIRHLPALEVRKLVPQDIWNSYYKFSFVRNVWDFQVSLYHYHLQRKLDGTPPPAFYLQAVGAGDFKKWVKVSFWKGALATNFLCDQNGSLMVDFVGRHENFQKDFDAVCDKVGMPRIVLPHEQRSIHEHYSKYYDEETRELVRRNFGPDIDAFGFEFQEAS